MGINNSKNVKQLSGVYEITTKSGMRLEVLWSWYYGIMNISSWDLNTSVKHLSKTGQSFIEFHHLGHHYTVNVFSDGKIYITCDGVLERDLDIHQFSNSI